MQVIGICRFSYPALGGFQVEHDSPAARAAYLYAPDRMEDRFRSFAAFTLPAIRAQTDPDFAFLIVVGDNLPEAYGNRLWDLTRDIPQVVIQQHAPGPHRAVMQRAINSLRDPGRVSLQFRLDDDDAVGVDFVARLRREAAARADTLKGNRHIALDFRNGYLASPGPGGIMAAETDAPFMTAGLAMALEPGVGVTVMNFSHVRLHRFMQCHAIGGDRMYVRGHDRWNDSRQGDAIAPADLRLLDDAGRAAFRDRFAIDDAAVARLFSGSAAPPGAS